jgi:hypothetical protein
MDQPDLRLDGNAAAGLLAEVFAFEATTATICCGACGNVGQLGELPMYHHGMGAVLRCPRCDGAMVRVGQGRGRYLVDLRGSAYLAVEAG